MMIRWSAGGLLTACVVMSIVTSAAAGQRRSSQHAFRDFTVVAPYLQGPIEGPWEWSRGVTVTAPGMTMTCDRLKVWFTPDARDAERVEAVGSIVIRGRYAAADKTEWEVLGRAESASYERKSEEGVLRGSVNFEATNLATGAVLSVVADKLVYEVKTRRFRFERIENPVHVRWQEPAAEQQEGGKDEAEP